MTQALVPYQAVNFHGDELAVIRQDGITYAPVKPICDALGLDWSAQRRRIERDEVLQQGMAVMATPSSGGIQDMVCLPADMLHGWLFGVEVKRVRPELRERLILYKRECYRVLCQAFTGQQPTPAPFTPEEVATLKEIAAQQQAQPAPLLVSPVPRGEPAEEVLAALRQLGGQGRPRDVCRLLPSASYTAVRLRLWRMAQRGMLRRLYKGCYTVEQAG